MKFEIKKMGVIAPVIILFILVVLSGETKVNFFHPTDEDLLILKELRLPRALVSFFSGVALSASGLLLQSFFRNPLAGPFVLGVHSGAGLGVALFVMGGSALGISHDFLLSLGIPLSSVLGSLVVISALLVISYRFEHYGILLVVGLLISYLCGGAINILIFSGAPQEIKSFLLWGLGSFDKLSLKDSLYFSSFLFFLSVVPLFFSKQLDIFTLGEHEAQAMGINTRRLKIAIIFLSSVLSGLVTAFCGPIVFVGMIAPHVARFFSQSSFYRFLIPQTLFLGGALALFAEWLVIFIFDHHIPINSVLGLLGAPVIVFLILKSKGERAL